MRRVAMLTLAIYVLLTAGCSTKGAVKIDKYSDEDKEYYEQLESFDNQDRNTIEKYIQIYVNYSGFDIPEDELNFLKNNTADNYYNEILKMFFNTMHLYESNEIDDGTYSLEGEGGYFEDSEYTDEHTEMDIINGDIYEEEVGEEELGEEELGTDENEGSNSTVTDILYNFKENTYIAKIGTPSGISYIMYVKVKDGKVVDIYAY